MIRLSHFPMGICVQIAVDAAIAAMAEEMRVLRARDDAFKQRVSEMQTAERMEVEAFEKEVAQLKVRDLFSGGMIEWVAAGGAGLRVAPVKGDSN
jgi:hypothetical protein